jgi:hypothetical protein
MAYTRLRRRKVSDLEITRILALADSYAAQMIEEHARPDDRWGPGCS